MFLSRTFMTTRQFPVHRVAVIGAGASGLTAAKYLKAERYFEVIDVYDQRNAVGGIWNHCSQTTGDGLFQVPRTQPNPGMETPARRNGPNDRVFISALYDNLEVNIPKRMMEFSDFSFPKDIPVFPGHEHVLEYLHGYGEDIRELIKFDTQVTNIRRQESATWKKETWVVESLHFGSKETNAAPYDAIVVANGHYSVPFIPPIEGIKSWNTKYISSITHSKYYRNPDPFPGKRIIVVGSSASGLDISSQLTAVAQSPVYLSQKSISEMAAGFTSDPDLQHKGQIVRLLPDTRTAVFDDGSEVQNVDVIIFATGYFYSLPFLHGLTPNPIDDGVRVVCTYQHLFSIAHPSLTFIGLPQKVVPFPLAEMQAAVVARVYSGRLDLPSVQKMEAWETSHLKECGRTDEFHTLAYPKDADYMDLLVDWAETAEKREGLENEGNGKLPRRWSPKMRWQRERIAPLRMAFRKLGDGRFNVRTVEELGFVFKEEVLMGDGDLMQ